MKLILNIPLILLVFTVNFSNAQVGIGTTNPDASSILDVTSTSQGLLFPRLSTVNRNAIVLPAKGLTIFNTTANQIQINVGTPGAPIWTTLGQDTSGIFDEPWFNTTTNTAATSNTQNIYQMGNVGIGTTNPLINLAIGDNDTGIKQQGDGEFAILTNGIERFRVNSIGNVGIGTSGFIDLAIGDNDTGIQQQGDGEFAIITNGSERLRVNNAGDVGIGTTSPQFPLSVESFQIASNFTSNFNSVVAQFRSNLGNNLSTIGFGNLGSTNDFNVRIGSNDNDFVLYTSNTERMRVRTGGNIGINTSTPSALLSVNGNANKPGGGNWGTFSDQRVKKNINDYNKGLTEILAIHPVTFEYNGIGFDADGKTYVGVIAQEIEKVLPTTVTKTEYKEFKDLRQYDGSELTYTLINAIKELKAEIESLKLEVKKIKK